VLFLFVFPVTYADSGVTWPQLNPATGTGFSGTALRTAIHSPGDDSRDDGRAKNNESRGGKSHQAEHRAVIAANT
jgi:hypothetical protein